MNIIVTGTSKGIGKELALHFLKKHNVFGCSRSASTIEHNNYIHFCLDICSETDVVNMVKNIKEVDVLINNAGIASMNHILLSPFQVLEKIYKTNVFGSFIFLRECAKLMIKKKQGRIINFTTIAHPLDLEGELIYASSKAAIESITRIASKELAPLGITVNAVGPTPVPTDLIKNVPKSKMDQLLRKQPIPRMGTIDDIINVIEFFISKNSDFVTGQTIYLGGVN